ncbi:hypothetical protein AKO1_015519 [Acrasis kona]|uniref:Uncharacterized protein n=1 Tax=Acrasis kona TaxID=1008807 RepID=A0AAW2YNI6_9EUKA
MVVTDDALKYVIGVNHSNLSMIAKFSGCLLSCKDSTITIQYNKKDQLIKAKKKIQEAINNSHVVFSHPDEANIILDLPNDFSSNATEILFREYEQSANGIFYTLVASPTDKIQKDSESSHKKEITEQNLVKYSVIRANSESVSNELINRFCVAVVNANLTYSCPVLPESVAERKIHLNIGRQLFYKPKTANQPIFHKDHPSATKIHVRDFERFEIGHGKDIKTMFDDLPKERGEKVLEIINSEFNIYHQVPKVCLHFIDVVHKSRFCCEFLLDEESDEPLSFLSFKTESKKHVFLALTKVTNKEEVQDLALDYRLKMVSQHKTKFLDSINDKEIINMIESISWNEVADENNERGLNLSKVDHKRFLVDDIIYTRGIRTQSKDDVEFVINFNTKTSFDLDEITEVYAVCTAQETDSVDVDTVEKVVRKMLNCVESILLG